MRRIAWFTALLLLAFFSSANAQTGQGRGQFGPPPGFGPSPNPNWVLLGERSVGFNVDRDVIDVAYDEGWYRTRAFRALQFVARGNDIELIRIRINYINGYSEDFNVRQVIRQGASLPVDLGGDRSYIRQIQMVYRARPDFRGRAQIQVFGEPTRVAGPPGNPGPFPPSGGFRPDPNWVLLGERSVGFGVDRDVIDIAYGEDWYRSRSFRALHFIARGNDIEMIRVRITYYNGFTEDFNVNQVVRQGSDLPVDLGGERSYLRQIQMVYRARPDFRGRADMQVFGEPARFAPPPGPPPGPANWVLLGCEQVKIFGTDRDVIPVGRREGRFQAIRLSVEGSDIDLYDLRVVYANGEPDMIAVRSLLRAGERTRSLDLRGRDRVLRQIELVYQSTIRPSDIVTGGPVRRAKVCVEGLQGN